MGILPGDQLSILLQMAHTYLQRLKEADAEGDGGTFETAEQGRVTENQEFNHAVNAVGLKAQ